MMCIYIQLQYKNPPHKEKKKKLVLNNGAKDVCPSFYLPLDKIMVLDIKNHDESLLQFKTNDKCSMIIF